MYFEIYDILILCGSALPCIDGNLKLKIMVLTSKIIHIQDARKIKIIFTKQ